MENRSYPRERINIQCAFFVEGAENEKREFTGIIGDLSEGGMKVKVISPEDVAKISEVCVGTKIKFQSVDEYTLMKEVRCDILEGELTVVRISHTGNDIVIGCKIVELSPELEEYLGNKRLVSFYLNDIV